MKLSRDLTRKVLALAGEQPGPAPSGRRQPPEVRTDGPSRWSISLTLPCRVISEANRRDHWSSRRRRVKAQSDTLIYAWQWAPVVPPNQWHLSLPCVVTFTHVGPRMDDDNLAGAFKGLRDAMAELLGVDDGDARVTWKYEQRTGTPGVELRIEGVV